ncbi:MAG: hypothetical protein SNJ54_17280 [Anaerolineae bacterium]
MTSVSLPVAELAPAATRAGHWRERALYTATLLLTALFWLPQAIRWMDDSDFGPHGEDVVRTLDSLWWVITNIPHFLFQALSAGVVRLLNVDVPMAMAIVITLATLTLGAVLFVVFRRALAGDHALTWPQGALVMGAVLALLVVAPLAFFNAENLYFGFFAPNVYHNPTVNLMKPSAVALFFAGLACFHPAWRPRPLPLWMLGYILLTAICLFSKPNFIIAWLPPMALATLYFMARRRPIHWALLIGGIVLPAGLLLFIQTQTWTGGAGIEISPFEIYDLWALHYEPTANQDLLLKHAASIVFPLLVYLLYLPQAARSLTFNVAWLTFFVGAAYVDLLIDRSNPTAGDFMWGAQFGVFLLFMAALLLLLRQMRAHGWRDPRLLLVGLALAAHLFAGANWYYLHLTRPYLQLIYIWW